MYDNIIPWFTTMCSRIIGLFFSVVGIVKVQSKYKKGYIEIKLNLWTGHLEKESKLWVLFLILKYKDDNIRKILHIKN
ncbi:hypothetical protein KQI89_17090 [Clostridium sp. MSJ-4]|uniref:Uncharacterized protein n=1 Tax=Clostridium simiarum TaxID=2841506 RepID=A0ABS6F4P9_9CLOT|nr:hypothetical protein [Clostridium simiarum]